MMGSFWLGADADADAGHGKTAHERQDPKA